MANHPIVHVEFSANDRVAAGEFYHKLFGWEVKQFPDMNYATFMTGDTSPGGGLNPVNADNPAGTIMVYVGTEDIQGSLQQVTRLGGQVCSEPMPIPGVGLFATFKDPTGNTLGLLQADESIK